MKRPLLIITLLMTLLFIPASAEAAVKGGEGTYVQTRVSRNKVTAGDNVVYEVVLFTPNPAIEGIEPVAFPGFEGIQVSRSAPDTRLTQTEIKGKPYYTAVIDRYFLHFPDEGNYSIKGGVYNIGHQRRQEYYDPFWGRSVGTVVDVSEAPAPVVSVKVTPLPGRGRPDNFSGAVGDFEIMAELPRGEIRSGEDALIVVTISGIGSLEGVELPDIPSMLPEGLQFKSMTDNVSHYVKDGELGSEVEIECVVVPKREGKYVIDSLRFNFYNSKTGKYETTTAPPLEMEAADALPGSGRPPVIMEI